jgi:2-keto-4-pentenoate hydratase/2-oxohepta-3-ene-1,7-dioic acid hydratase in catechol pathway
MNAVLGLMPYLGDEIKKEIEESTTRLPLEGTRLGPPVTRPRNIFGIGMNYGRPPVDVPNANDWTRAAPPIFTKPAGSLIGCRDAIVLPPETKMLDYEVEIAVVIGRQGRNIAADAADAYVAGVTVGNDVTAHDIMLTTSDLGERASKPALEAQFLVGKGFDTFMPLGPWITTADSVDLQGLTLSSAVNGEMRQRGHSRDMDLSVPEVIALISRFATVYPGDIILTGTPAGTGLHLRPPRFLVAGDEVVARVEPYVGELRNLIVGEAGCV